MLWPPATLTFYATDLSSGTKVEGAAKVSVEELVRAFVNSASLTSS